MKSALILTIAIFGVMLTACTPDSDSKEALMSLVVPVDVEPVSLNEPENDQSGDALVDQISSELEKHEDVYDAMVVQSGKQILVAYKVHQLKRFNMEKVEADLNKKLEEEYPGYEFLVTSDMKIFLEAVELAVHVDQENYPSDMAKDWFDKIVELEKEQT